MRVAHLLPLLALFGCGDSLYDFLGQGGRPLKGDDAFQHLAVDPAAAAPVDLAAVMTVLGDEERQAAGEDAVFADDADVLKLRRRSVQQRLAIDESRFELVDFAEWGDVVQKQSCDLSVNVRDLYDEYVIPQAERVPVRNQGARGTCAAAGKSSYPLQTQALTAFPQRFATDAQALGEFGFRHVRLIALHEMPEIGLKGKLRMHRRCVTARLLRFAQRQGVGVD